MPKVEPLKLAPRSWAIAKVADDGGLLGYYPNLRDPDKDALYPTKKAAAKAIKYREKKYGLF